MPYQETRRGKWLENIPKMTRISLSLYDKNVLSSTLYIYINHLRVFHLMKRHIVWKQQINKILVFSTNLQ